jgi:hypothetical protein
MAAIHHQVLINAPVAKVYEKAKLAALPARSP